MKRIFISAFLLGHFFSLMSSNDSLKVGKKKQIYASWGYTRAWYTPSDIHFQDLSNNYHPATGKNNYYDFTIYDAKANDRPDFNAIPDIVNLTIPQFVIRLGYYFNENTGIELNYDHTKYVVNGYQTAHIKGQIDGVYMDKDTILDSQKFLAFEHTDGANFWMVNFLKKVKIYEGGKNFKLCYVAKPGAGIVFPRTDVTLFGENLNNDWKVAGFIAGFENGLRVEFLKHGVFEFVTKGTYANYLNAFILGAGNGKASHHFFCGQFTASIGLMFGKN